MKADSGMGYIFSKYEIICILRTMGCNYLFDYSLESDLTAKEIIEKAKKSLAEKNYVFYDFSGNFVLNKEIVEYFQPIVFSESIIACKKRINFDERKIMFFVKDNAYVTVEFDNSNEENYILTYISDCKKIFNDMISFFETDKATAKEANAKFSITPKQYKQIKSVLKEDDFEGFKLLVSDFEINEELIDDVKNVFLENADIITFSFCNNRKNKKTDCFTYYLTDKYIWAVVPDIYNNGNIRISSVTFENICGCVANVLRDKLNIPIDNLQNLFD